MTSAMTSTMTYPCLSRITGDACLGVLLQSSCFSLPKMFMELSSSLLPCSKIAKNTTPKPRPLRRSSAPQTTCSHCSLLSISYFCSPTQLPRPSVPLYPSDPWRTSLQTSSQCSPKRPSWISSAARLKTLAYTRNTRNIRTHVLNSPLKNCYYRLC